MTGMHLVTFNLTFNLTNWQFTNQPYQIKHPAGHEASTSRGETVATELFLSKSNTVTKFTIYLYTTPKSYIILIGNNTSSKQNGHIHDS